MAPDAEDVEEAEAEEGGEEGVDAEDAEEEEEEEEVDAEEEYNMRMYGIYKALPVPDREPDWEAGEAPRAVYT